LKVRAAVGFVMVASFCSYRWHYTLVHIAGVVKRSVMQQLRIIGPTLSKGSKYAWEKQSATSWIHTGKRLAGCGPN
jgi:hypothetical protein